MAKVSISHKGTICIYGILSPSNKIYIGQTRDLYHRYKSGVSKSQRLLFRSYKKYGEDNHKLFIIAEFNSDIVQVDLDYWECYYIDQYKADGFKMLNIREGGGNNGKLAEETKKMIGEKSKNYHIANPEWSKRNIQKLIQSNTGSKRSIESKLAISAALKLHERSKDHCKSISDSKKGKSSPRKGKHVSATAADNIRKAAKTRNQKKCPIIQYSLQGEFIKEWGSIKEAALTLNLPTGTIGGCIRKEKHYKTCGGFIWRYKIDDSPIITEDHIQSYNPKRCPVIQMDNSGNVINQFVTVKQAVESTGINKASIIMCAKGTRKHAGGFTWRYK